MVDRSKHKSTPLEAIFSDVDSQARARSLQERVSVISGVTGLTAGYIRGVTDRKLFVVVEQGADVVTQVSCAINEVFPDRISKRRLPCELVTDEGLRELKSEFQGGRKMILETIWTR